MIGFIDTSLQFYNSSHIELLLNNVCLMNPLRISHQSLTNLGLISTAESESYVTTYGQSASLSWNKALIWGLRPDLDYCQTVVVCWCGAFSLTRGRVCRLQLLLVLASAVKSRPYFTVSDLGLPFSSPHTTCRVTVEVFDPASTQVFCRIELSWVLYYDRRSAGQSILE
jgi:hypothetical protein